METSLKPGFAQIFSCCPKNLSCPKFGGGCSPPRPFGPYAYECLSAKEDKPHSGGSHCRINICYSPAGRSVLEETVPEVLSTSRGRTQTEGTVSPNMDRPRLVNNISIFFQQTFKSFREISLHSLTHVS